MSDQDNYEERLDEYKERLNELAGRIHALTTFGFAVICAHPEPAILEKMIDACEQIGLAKVETALVAESYLNGFQDTIGKLKVAASARARRAAQDKDRDRS